MAVYSARWFISYSFMLLLICSFITNNCNGMSSSSWWAVGLSDCSKRVLAGNESCPNCAQFANNKVFTTNQAAACRSEPQSRHSLSRGALSAILDCQRRFNQSRWNCTTLYGQYPFGRFVADNHTRETAVLNAYFTAGAIWGIADDCHNQRIPSCPCSVTNPSTTQGNNVIFEICRADFGFAASYVNNFVLGQFNSTPIGVLVDTHNVNVGERLMNREIQQCRCHGVSGTCTVQTCYTRTPSVEEVGDVLFQRYTSAAEVELQSNQLVRKLVGADPPTGDSLVYSSASPNFCIRNTNVGTVGVAHRKCVNDNPNAPNACSSLCCDHGAYPVTKTVPVEECQFVWCCRIECSITRNDTVTEYFCNPSPVP